jgi:hypothetical protein
MVSKRQLLLHVDDEQVCGSFHVSKRCVSYEETDHADILSRDKFLYCCNNSVHILQDTLP